MNATRGFGFHSFAKLTAFTAFILVFVGALVTSTGSALAVPDWPLSFGEFFPPMTGGVLFEHGHRVIAGLVALMTLSLALWAYFSSISKPLKLLSYLIAAAILLQAVLGALTVLLLLPPSIAVFHAALGQTVFCLLLALAETSSTQFKPTPVIHKLGLWKYGLAALLALYLQLIFGAILRHSGEFGFLHYSWSIAAALSVIVLAFVGIRSRIDSLKPISIFLGVFVFLQVFLGLLSYMRRLSLDIAPGFGPGALLTASHVALGALLLGASMIWTLRAYQLQ
jgi:cytochrome c oxidase assembly protein subunit 15